MSMGAHQSARMKSDVWLTPPEILSALGPFDLDPCAAPEPRPWDTAKTHYTREQDGLSQPWHGRVWLNPPYSRDARRWLAALANHGNGIALIFARTETSWFRQWVWDRAWGLLFLDGRVHFHHRDGSRAKANSGAPSVLVAYGSCNADTLKASGLRGAFVTDWI